ncbi:conserved hypothetical protein [Candidatus Caldarchaeum subterraneum]|nr:conserved hypothetical protein [Candidatus Caldarchaeum subterraneum]BAJ49126.1 conserved hypothetical protein [Candidatus Caldarchaeum subterraneum]BAJ50030.1 conserved hypothetical protein [Candidatus Caldarchaeum subterraneum]GBC72469.1 hypothetical protein HRbin03_00298 [archaeon HR03]
MPDLNQARMIGGIGSILLVLTIVPNVGPVLSIVGFILVLLALKYVSDTVQQPAIFQNALYAVIIGIVGAVIAMVLGGAALFAAVGPGFGGGFGDGVSGDFFSLLAGVVVALVVVWIFAVVSAFFLRKSLYLTSDVLGVKLFRTGGLLLFLGAILTIILVGFILSLVAYVLLAVAFFQIPQTGGQPPPPPPPPPP